MIIKYIKAGKSAGTEGTNCDMTVDVEKKRGRRRVTVTALSDITLVSAEYDFKRHFDDRDLIFLNGYQSWTDTKEYTLSEKQNNLKNVPKALVNKYAFDAEGDQAFYDFPRNTLHGFELCYVKGDKEFFLGNLNYKNAYLIIEIYKKSDVHTLLSDLSGKTMCAGESFTIFDFMLSDSIEAGKAAYFAQMRPRSERMLFGYTSWYNQYTNIDENIIQKALELSDERFELFQIDDGFEEYVGDWKNIDKKKFPNGLMGIVERIHEKRMLAGIWLAPFVAEKNSHVFREHPDWIAADEEGMIKAGANWSGFYPLDCSKKEVISYIRECLRYYRDMGFDFFKLDFLYAVNLKPLPGLTRAQTSVKLYSLLREELGDRLLLGCGACISSAYEVFDYMRIGPDVSLKFDDEFYMRLLHRERISTKVTVQNTIYRSMFDGKAFLNDPDVFLLRDDNIGLSREQRYALTMINALFGSLFMTSDNPKTYDEAKKQILERALTVFRSAEEKRYLRRGNDILISFVLDAAEYEYTYNTEKGVFVDG